MKKIMKYIYPILSLLLSYPLQSQVPVPAKSQETPIMLVGATIHTATGKIIENGSIGFDGGKITVIGKAEDISTNGYTVQMVDGQHIYPGFILPLSQLGLSEVGSIRAMADQNETGTYNPNVRALISYNTDSENIPTFRFNGILLAQPTPVGGTISGMSSVMELDGWNWEDAVHSADIGIHLSWPRRTTRQFDFSTFTIKSESNTNYNKHVSAVQSFLREAAAFGREANPTANLKLEAMQGLFDGSKRLFIAAGQAQEIVESINFAEGIGIQNIVLITQEEALQVTPFLKEKNIPVIIPPTHSLPSRTDQPVDRPYALPHLLTQAGLVVSMHHQGMLANARNLPFYAGTAAAYGMSKESALQIITLNAAKALGIDDKVGSLEVGKEATLFVSQGDALDMLTNNLSSAYIRGKKITLDSRQQELYKRYSEKYGHSVN